MCGALIEGVCVAARKGEAMTHAQQMIETHPGEPAVDAGVLSRCIEACYDCAQSCTACADACLGEQDFQTLIRCIRLNLDCADVCATTGNVLTREVEFEPGLARPVVQACLEACRLCADECERHAEHMEHCRVCADSCRACEQACNEILSSLAA
jgi:hypothetical protein